MKHYRSYLGDSHNLCMFINEKHITDNSELHNSVIAVIIIIMHAFILSELFV